MTSADVMTFADNGYQGARGERAIATSRPGKILAKVRCPRRATAIVQAILVLHQAEANRYAG